MEVHIHGEISMQDFKGKTAVVTGAASGIGKAVATRLAAEGMNVVLADIEVPALDAVVGGLAAKGHRVVGVPTDVSKAEAIEHLARMATKEFGAIHLVHNNAGVVTAGRAETLSVADYEWVLGVDLWSVIHGVRTFLPLLEASGEGHMINTASTAGLMASPNIAPYNIAKFGVVALTETVARELEMRNSPIGVSVLCPGAINTQIVFSDRNRPDASAALHPNSVEEEQFKKRAGGLLANQGLAPEAVAEMIVNAVRSKQFWILTHTDWKRVMRRRVEAMCETDSLITDFGG